MTTISQPITGGFYATTLLLDPVGFDAAYATSTLFLGKEKTEFLEVADVLMDELHKEGVNTQSMQYHLDDLKIPWSNPFPPTAIDSLATQLRNIDREKFFRAAGRVATTRNMIFDTSSKACRKALAAVMQTKKPWTFWTVPYNRDYGRWADRLYLAGRIEEARHFYRHDAFAAIRAGKKMMGYAGNSRDRNMCDLAEFQFGLAANYFFSAARQFQKAESDINRIKTMTLAKKALQESDVMKNANPTEAPQRASFFEMLSVFDPGEIEPDHELVYYARYAAIGGDEAVEEFAKKTAEVLQVEATAILQSLVESNGALFKKLKQLIGKENVMLEHLIRTAHRYASKKEGVAA